MKLLQKIFRFSSQKREKPLEDSPVEMMEMLDRSKSIRWFIIAILWIACAAAVFFPYHSTDEILIKDQRAPSSIFAECDFSYVDEKLTEAAREQAAQNEPIIYRIDQQISANIILQLQTALAKDGAKVSPTSKENKILTDENFGEKMRQFFKSSEHFDSLVNELKATLDDGIINNSERELRKGEKLRIMDDKGRLRKRILKIESIFTPAEAAEYIALRISQNIPPANRKIIQNEIAMLMGNILTGNLAYDENETKLRRKKSAEAVAPIVVDVKKGALIMEKGMIINEYILNKYNAYITEKERLSFSGKMIRKGLAGIILSFILVLLTGIYMYHIHPEVVRSNKQIGVVAFVTIANIALNTATIRVFYALLPSHNLPPYLAASILPLALSSVTLSVLIGLRIALYTGLFVSLIAAIQMDYSFSVVLNGMVLSTVAGFAVRYSKNYRDFFIKSLIAISLTMPLMDTLWLLSIGERFRLIVNATKAGIISAPLIVLICIGILLLVETIFRAYSNMNLLTFCDYNHPLLKKMQIEAPGTYHHSLVVSTLAEQAARDIGANAIQARVGALFHDIGKISKPDYFTENNLDGNNRHEELSPRMSSIVILNHVKEGVELALKYKLPRIVRDCILEHHGNDMISFFYKRALDEKIPERNDVHEWDYRYPGPLPRSKETAIVSLADSSEAASRSIEKPNPSKIDAVIGEIFRKKIRDGQLDNADITMRELNMIRKSFVKTITTMMHGRISYPKDEETNEEDDLFNGTLHKGSKPK